MHIKAWLVGTRLPTVTYRLIVLNNQWHAARISSLTFFILLRATLIIIFMSWWVFKFQIYYFLALTKTEELISILTISALIFTDKNTEIILLIIISTCWYLTKNNVMVTVLCFMAHMTVVSSNVTFFQNGRKYQKWKPPKTNQINKQPDDIRSKLFKHNIILLWNYINVWMLC